MQAMAITSFDGPGGLDLRELAAPTPGPGEVEIAVEHAGANFVEALMARRFRDVPLPFVPGIEASGRILSTGEGVDASLLGQRVAALTIGKGGGYGGTAVTHSALVAPVPVEMDSSLASAVPSNSTTALMVCERVARIDADDRVLVLAATGGLGSQLGQIAKRSGASVVAVVGSAEKVPVAHELGYDSVILRSELGDVRRGSFSVVLDPVGGAARRAAFDALDYAGRHILLGNASREQGPAFDGNEVWLSGKTIAGYVLGTEAARHPETVGGYLREAVRLVSAGDLKVVLSDILPLSEASEALRRLESGTTVGKIVLEHPGR